MPRKRRQPPTIRRQPAAASWELILHNDDALTEILLRLPAKSLIKFKSVCKKWLSLISSDYFCHQHTLLGPKLQPSLLIGTHHGSKLLYFNGENVAILYSLSKPHKYIRQDCNGLLLLLKSERHKKKYYVCNPTTGQSRKITLTKRDKFPNVEAVALAFDPSKSPYYKIVCVRSGAKYGIEVYDSESHTWKLSLKTSTFPGIYNDGVHYNNSIFWSFNGGDGYCCFDIAKNEIKNLSFPQGSSYSPESLPYLQESNGRLYFIKLVKGYESVSVAMWELGGDDHSRWLFKHGGEIYPHSVGDSYCVRFVGGWGGDGATCSLLMYENSPPRIMAYNFLDDSYELLVHLPSHPGCLCGGLLSLQFGETLALV